MKKHELDRSLTFRAMRCAQMEACGVIMLGHDDYALVDMADFAELSKHKWHKNGRGHAARLVTVPGRKSDAIVYMHRQILGLGKGQMCDHRSRNKLDNRRNNLRLCSFHQNNGNVSKRNQKRTPTSKLKGVSWDSGKRKWLAQGNESGKCKFLGRFNTETDAAVAYNAWASKYFGEFAFLNPI